MTDLKKIEWTPYRGSNEPILKTNIAKMVFHDRYLEVMMSYDYKWIDGGIEKIEEERYQCLIPRNMMSVERTVAYPKDNPEYECDILYIDSPSIDHKIWIWVGEPTIGKLYNELKSWLMLTGEGN